MRAHGLTDPFERARAWAIASDPGLLRLRQAGRTTLALAAALLVLFALTRMTGQPLTVALLGAVVAMISARAVNEPDPRAQQITMALLPLPAAAAISVATLLAPHRVVADVAFVVIIFVAVYLRRFGGRGMALGMVAFMTYFFTLFLRATVDELPWLIVAVVVGTACSFGISRYVLPDRPERVLRRTVSALRARMATVVGTAADAVAAGRFDDRQRHRLALRIARLNETALLAQGQLEDRVDPATVWPGVDGSELALRLFDAELTVERVAGTAARAASADVAAATRAELAAQLGRLAAELRTPGSVGLQPIRASAQALADAGPGVAVRRVAVAVDETTAVIATIRALAERGPGEPAADGADAAADRAVRAQATEPVGNPVPGTGLRPTTRQAIQVAVAASLAIVAGELVSPARWYWAVIAAFVTFAGTASFGETLTKGWQRLLGTVLGVPSGVLVATAVSGNAAVSVVLIFVCLFCAFYLMKVAYGLMIFWLTTMLALMYGLLGEFSVDLLLLRIEETAIGIVIGVAVAVVVLPTRTGTAIRADARAFLTGLSGLVETCAATLAGDGAGRDPTEQARGLQRQLQQFRTSAKPVSLGIAGIAGRTGIRRGLRLLKACDHYARTLARASDGSVGNVELAGAVRAAAAQTSHNIDALVATLDRRADTSVQSAADLLDTADALAGSDRPQLPAALHALRQIDRAVVAAAVDLGAGQVTPW